MQDFLKIYIIPYESFGIWLIFLDYGNFKDLSANASIEGWRVMLFVLFLFCLSWNGIDWKIVVFIHSVINFFKDLCTASNTGWILLHCLKVYLIYVALLLRLFLIELTTVFNRINCINRNQNIPSHTHTHKFLNHFNVDSKLTNLYF